MKFSLLPLLTAVVSVVAQDKGSVVAPASGTAIAPGAAFDFSFFGRADYGVSSYAYSVYLVGADVLQKPLAFSDVFTNGHYFGRYDYVNYPAVPYAKNPAPAQLTMPDFSKSPGGWGAGQNATNVNFTLLVVEEYADGSGSVGKKFGVSGVPVIYNATSA